MVESPDFARTAPRDRSRRPNDRLIEGVTDLVHHARLAELPLADELLTDILATLNGWPVGSLSRLR